MARFEGEACTAAAQLIKKGGKLGVNPGPPTFPEVLPVHESTYALNDPAESFTSLLAIWQYGGMVKVTFTLDDDTVARLRRIAARARKPQSLVVREAIAEYAARGERLTEDERTRALKAYDALAPAVRRRPAAEIARELRELRTARRSGGRRTAAR